MARALAVVLACLVLVIVSGLWPPSLWSDYVSNTTSKALNLPGSALIRLPKKVATQLQHVTAILDKHCDTYYSAPQVNSFYVFAGLKPPTGLVANVPGQLNESEQRRVVARLAELNEQGKRVCVIRDKSQAKLWNTGYGHGPLRYTVAHYTQLVGATSTYVVFRLPSSSSSS